MARRGPISPEERQRAGRDWVAVARLLDIQLIGWTGDQSATFWNPRGQRFARLFHAGITRRGLERRRREQAEARTTDDTTRGWL